MNMKFYGTNLWNEILAILNSKYSLVERGSRLIDYSRALGRKPTVNGVCPRRRESVPLFSYSPTNSSNIEKRWPDEIRGRRSIIEIDRGEECEPFRERNIDRARPLGIFATGLDEKVHRRNDEKAQSTSRENCIPSQFPS